MSDTQPTAEDLARDLTADLATCDSATPGPWIWGDAYMMHHEHVRVDVPFDHKAAHRDRLFIAAARTGWPAAVRRAMAAEAETERLRDALARCLDLLQSAQWGGYSCPSDVLIDQKACGGVVQAIRAALDKTT